MILHSYIIALLNKVKYLKIFDLIAPCLGDSGAPFWQTTNTFGGDEADICDKKNVLVAIFSASLVPNHIYPVCTTEPPIAHKITQQILKWIRKNMEKYDSETK